MLGWYIGEIMRQARNRWEVPPKQTLLILRRALSLDGELSKEARWKRRRSGYAPSRTVAFPEQESTWPKTRPPAPPVSRGLRSVPPGAAAAFG